MATVSAVDKGAVLSRGGLDRARDVLGSRDFRILLAARLVSQAAEGAFLSAVLATVVFLPESQSTVRGFAVATAITLLPFSLLEPFAGVFVDRWPRRPILVVLPLVRSGAALLALPGLGAVAAVYAGTLVVFSANRLFQATAAAVIPRVLGVTEERPAHPGEASPEAAGARPMPRPDDALLFTANMITAVAGTVTLFGGMFVGGLVMAALGTTATIALAGATWVAAAILASRLSSALPPRRPVTGALTSQLYETVLDLGDGFRRIVRTPGALAPILTVGAGQFLQVLVIAAALVVVKEELGADLVSFSGLVAAGGAGVFLGFLTAGALRSRMPSQVLIGAAFVLSALAVIPAAVSADALTLTLGAVLLGASYGWTRVPVDTLAQRSVPDRYRGRVFTAIDLAFSTSRVLAAVAAVAIVPLLGPQTTFAVLAVLFVLWAPVVPFWLGRGDRG